MTCLDWATSQYQNCLAQVQSYRFRAIEARLTSKWYFGALVLLGHIGALVLLGHIGALVLLGLYFGPGHLNLLVQGLDVLGDLVNLLVKDILGN